MNECCVCLWSNQPLESLALSYNKLAASLSTPGRYHLADLVPPSHLYASSPAVHMVLCEGGEERSTEDVSQLVIVSTHHRPLFLDAIKNLLHLLQKELLVLLRAHGTTEGEREDTGFMQSEEGTLETPP